MANSKGNEKCSRAPGELARKSRCYFLTSTFSLFIGYLYLLFASAESKEEKNEISLLGYRRAQK